MSQSVPKRPRIGITTDYNDLLTQHSSPYVYSQAVAAAGGLPFLLPYRVDAALVTDYLDNLDGMLFTGGNDLDPASFGEARHEKAVAIDPHREAFERALMAETEKRKLPTLGICLGSQLMNIHRGGTLNQFIPDLGASPTIEHRRLNGGEGWSQRHAVNLVPGTQVANAIGKATIQSNTSHKQSIRDVGNGLRVIATAPDGIIEGVEDPSLPLWVGVQWHPERQHDETDHLALFKLLVQKASTKA